MTASLPVAEHRDTFVNLFLAAANAAADLGQTPRHLSVSGYDVYNGTGRMVDVHLSNTAEVDAYADPLDLPADDGERTNYSRVGATTLAGRRVTVVVYCGRPKAEDAAEVLA